MNDRLKKNNNNTQVCVPRKLTVHVVFIIQSNCLIQTNSLCVPQDCSRYIRDKELHLDKCPLWRGSPNPF